jgi:hypothetical protein
MISKSALRIESSIGNGLQSHGAYITLRPFSSNKKKGPPVTMAITDGRPKS